MVLAFLVSLVTIVLVGEREREPGGQDRWAKGGSQEARKGMGREIGDDGGEESF